MFYLREPDEAQIRRWVVDCEQRAFNGPEVRIESLGRTPRGFSRDAHVHELGQGVRVFEAGRRALEAWAMYPPPWARVFAQAPTPHVGLNFITRVRHFGFVSLLPGRVLELVDEADPKVQRWGFAFGTLEGHAEIGVERFELRWSQTDERVCFCVEAISRPAGIVRLGRPIARVLQRRFHRQTGPAMRAATERVLAGRRPQPAD